MKLILFWESFFFHIFFSLFFHPISFYFIRFQEQITTSIWNTIWFSYRYHFNSQIFLIITLESERFLITITSRYFIIILDDIKIMNSNSDSKWRKLNLFSNIVNDSSSIYVSYFDDHYFLSIWFLLNHFSLKSLEYFLEITFESWLRWYNQDHFYIE